MNARILIYGAYGYTGELMVREAARRRLDIVIAGRSAAKLRPLADELNLEYRAFDVQQAASSIQGIGVVLNCAGPFSSTAQALVNACLAAGVHYVDITGEVPVFQACHQLDERAREAGIILCPGAGFDIVPTDCLAASLKDRLPEATRIDLAFSFGTRPSVGTIKTLVEGIEMGGLVRRGHQLKTVANAYRIRRIPFRDRSRWGVTIPWADVYTAGISTNTPDGMVYTALPLSLGILMRLTSPFRGALTLPRVQRWLMRLAEKIFPGGPDETQRALHRTQFWGEAVAADGRKVAMTFSAPSVYTLTVETALAISSHCIGSQARGYYTPSMLMGKGFLASLPGVETADSRLACDT
ncbi:Saccharopine dehydrogenase NADP binding domain protein [compost metagenome]